MLDINNALLKLKEQLEDSGALTDYGIKISQNSEVNEDPRHSPWLGIYTKSVRHDPLTLATTQRRWKGFITLILVVQATHLKSGEDCGELLENYIKDIITTIFNDTSFGNTIDMVNKLEVDYSYDKTISSTLHFQEAFITLEVEVEHEQ